MRAKDHRKPIPVGVKLKAALLAGVRFTEEQIESGGIQFDHFPALTLRSLDANGEITPASNDYRYIRPMLAADHDIKTRGRGATTAGSDVGAGAKLSRIEKDPPGGEEFRRRVLAVKSGEPKPEPGRRKTIWPKRPFQSAKKRSERS